MIQTQQALWPTAVFARKLDSKSPCTVSGNVARPEVGYSSHARALGRSRMRATHAVRREAAILFHRHMQPDVTQFSATTVFLLFHASKNQVTESRAFLNYVWLYSENRECFVGCGESRPSRVSHSLFQCHAENYHNNHYQQFTHSTQKMPFR